MKIRILISLLMLFQAGTLFCAIAPTDKPFLHGLFTDNMVLQRDVACPVWGWTQPGQKVVVKFHEKIVETVADADGKWMVKVGPFPAGGPYDLAVEGPQSVTLKNVLMGDIWLCSGQSNMEMGMKGVNQWWNEQASADQPQIRLAFIPTSSRFEPPHSVDTVWRVASRDTVFADTPVYGGFSAISFIFGREVYQQTSIPIGLIESCWGATSIVSWSKPETLRAKKNYEKEPFEVFHEAVDKVWNEMDPAFEETKGWAAAAFDDSTWKTIDFSTEPRQLPDDFSGVLWLRREVNIPADWTGKDLALRMGLLPDKDTLWWDGSFMDSSDVSGGYQSSRFYKIPARMVSAGRHVLALRMTTTKGDLGKGEHPQLQIAGQPSLSLPLVNAWRYRESTPTAALTPKSRYPERRDIWAGCYQAMIAPLSPFAIKGVLWYQGEGDVGYGGDFYHSALTSLIGDWRTLFGNPEMPFYLVQLSALGPISDRAGSSSGWAEVREAQWQVCREVSNTGFAVSIDRGEIYDIHPPNKQDVAKRLAAFALAQTYGKKISYLSPSYKSMKVEGRSVRLFFDGADGGLISKGGVPTGFEIAGADGKYVWANASIDGESIILSAPEVPDPTSARYGWSDHPLCNTYNRAGLPATPFRTGK